MAVTAVDLTCSQPKARVDVRAAGGLVVRRGPDGMIRLVLVHRLPCDDWTFPNSTQRRAESLLATSLRGVYEGTGFVCVAEDLLGMTESVDRREHQTFVRYWAMNRVRGSFSPNRHVDAIAWVRPVEALLRLSQQHDRELLESAVPSIEAVLERRQGQHMATTVGV